VIKEHISFIKKSVETIEIGSIKIFEGKILETTPSYGDIAAYIPCVRIKHNGAKSTLNNSSGYRKSFNGYNSIYREHSEEVWSYDIEFWIKDFETVFIDEDNFYEQAKTIFYKDDFLQSSNGEKIFFTVNELGGVGDPEDDDGTRKMVIRIDFIEKVYRKTDTPLMPDNIELEVETA